MKSDFLTKVLGCSTNRVDLQNCSVLLCQPYCEIQRNIRKIWNNRFLFSLTDKSWEEMLQIPTPVQKAQEVTFQQDIQHYKLFIAQNNFSSLFWKYSRFAVSRFFQFNTYFTVTECSRITRYWVESSKMYKCQSRVNVTICSV